MPGTVLGARAAGTLPQTWVLCSLSVGGEAEPSLHHLDMVGQVKDGQTSMKGALPKDVMGGGWFCRVLEGFLEEMTF